MRREKEGWGGARRLDPKLKLDPQNYFTSVGAGLNRDRQSARKSKLKMIG